MKAISAPRSRGRCARVLVWARSTSLIELEAEVVHARAELADVLREHVVGDDGGNRGKEAGGRGDQSFGDTGRDGAQGGGASRAEAVERVDDAPHRSEQADERRHGACSRQPGQAALQMRQFFGRGNLNGTLQSADANVAAPACEARCTHR